MVWGNVTAAARRVITGHPYTQITNYGVEDAGGKRGHWSGNIVDVQNWIKITNSLSLKRESFYRKVDTA